MALVGVMESKARLACAAASRVFAKTLTCRARFDGCSCGSNAYRRGQSVTSAEADPGLVAADSDLMLVERTVAGDQKAFELLVIKYQRRIQRLIGRMVRDVDLVEDIAQETFIRAYKALHQFRGDAQFYTWLYRIAVNTAKKSLMELKRDLTVSESFFKSDDDDETKTSKNELIADDTPETVFAAKEIATMVNLALLELPEDLRQAVTLREIEGLSYEEIAAAMSCPIGTVRSRIFRAREAISAKVKPMLENQSGKRW
jgi:RNA polymerase sigma-70 factor, ECF subfamily